MIRLYHFPLSPFCRKVRLTLAEKKLEVELVEERYWEPSPDFLRRNPAGKVPVLRWDSRVMSESQAICEYLEDAIPTPQLMPRDPEQRYEVRRLCAWFDDKFHDEVIRIPRTSRPAQHGSNIISIIWAGFWISAAGWQAM
jgi:glutathione S-transferase